MKTPQAIAIAARRESALAQFVSSAANFSALAADFMYGTPKRTKATMIFALALLALAAALPSSGLGALGACAI